MQKCWGKIDDILRQKLNETVRGGGEEKYAIKLYETFLISHWGRQTVVSV